MGLLDYGEIKATPRNGLLGLLSDALNAANDYTQRKDPTMPGGFANPALAGIAGLLSLPAVATTTERMSYGEPLTNFGKANVPFLRPETADAAMAVAPMAVSGVRKAGAVLSNHSLAEAISAAASPKYISPASMGRVGMGGQGGMALFTTDGLPDKGRALIQSSAESLSDRLRGLGFSVDVTHSGSAAGPSSYLNVSDPKTGKFFNDVRLSGHSKGAFNSAGVMNVATPEEFDAVVSRAMELRNSGPAAQVLRQQQIDKIASDLIGAGMKPRTAYKQAQAKVDGE